MIPLPGSLAAYVSLTLLLAATPGATTAIVVRGALAGGRRSGLLTALGAACGNVTQAVGAGLGVAVLLRHQPRALDVIRVAGSIYLAWLGLKSLRTFARGTSLVPHPAAASADHRSAFREGWTGNLLNPSVTTFYATIVPTFIPPGGGATAFAMLASIHVACALACHTGWALALHSLNVLFARPGFGRALEALTGLALIALAIRLYL